MASPRSEIRSHPAFRTLSNEFFKPYPPYVLVDSETDASAVLSAGCEPEYLVVLDVTGPPGTKNLKSNNIHEYKERIGILICMLPDDIDLRTVAGQSLTLLATGGTAIGFASPKQADAWRWACTEWAQQQKTQDAQGQEQDAVSLEWSVGDMEVGGWVHWSVVKKAPEWAFC